MNIIQAINTQLKPTVLVILTIFACVQAVSAWAGNYMVEAILFENENPSAASESNDYRAPQPMRSNATTWVLEPSMLLDDAERLEKSPDYLLHHHFSWGQEALPYRASATYTVIERNARGYIKVYADDLLFVNIDLDFQGFRMQEKRRLKLNEQHFFDHPKFGLVLRVSRLLPEEGDTDIEDDTISQQQAQELEAAR